MIQKALFVTMLLVMSGCVTKLSYHEEYIASLENNYDFARQIDGKLVVVIPKDDGVYHYIGNPSSMLGGGTTIKIPLGGYSENIAHIKLKRLFSDGLTISDSFPTGGETNRYTLLVKIFEFDYRYIDKFFLQYPTARLKALVQLKDGKGLILFDKIYTTPFLRSKKSYPLPIQVSEGVNQITHKLIEEMYENIINDIRVVTEYKNHSKSIEL